MQALEERGEEMTPESKDRKKVLGSIKSSKCPVSHRGKAERVSYHKT